MEEDSWLWHMYDTVKGSDWLGDQVKNIQISVCFIMLQFINGIIFIRSSIHIEKSQLITNIIISNKYCLHMVLENIYCNFFVLNGRSKL